MHDHQLELIKTLHVHEVLRRLHSKVLQTYTQHTSCCRAAVPCKAFAWQCIAATRLHDLHVVKPITDSTACLLTIFFHCAVSRTRVGHRRGSGIGVQQHLCDSAVPRKSENPL